jgi:hypothetical protein
MEFRLCCAGRHADGRAVALQVSAVRVIRGGVLPRLGLPSGARVKGEGLLLLFRRSPNRERDFYLNPCTVEEMVFWWVGLGKGELLARTFREPRGAVLR